MGQTWREGFSAGRFGPVPTLAGLLLAAPGRGVGSICRRQVWWLLEAWSRVRANISSVRSAPGPALSSVHITLRGGGRHIPPQRNVRKLWPREGPARLLGGHRVPHMKDSAAGPRAWGVRGSEQLLSAKSPAQAPVPSPLWLHFWGSPAGVPKALVLGLPFPLAAEPLPCLPEHLRLMTSSARA